MFSKKRLFLNDKKITLIMLLFVAIDVFGQEKYTISGYITDISSGESIVGANIYSNNLQIRSYFKYLWFLQFNTSKRRT